MDQDVTTAPPQADARGSLAPRVADQVRKAIIAGDLAPGQRLTEQRLAAQHNVSRIPVREALRSLESEGFVTITPNRGAVVSHVGAREAADLIEVREALEVLIIHRAVARRSSSDIEALRATIAEAQGAIDDHEYDRLPHLNTVFHDRISDIAGNEIAARFGSQLREKIEWAYAADVEIRAERSWADHVELVDALEAGDKRRAAKVVRRHIDEVATHRRRLEHLEAVESEVLRGR